MTAGAMKALDLFCGAAGGWHFGFARAGIEIVAGCEADPWRRAVYAERYGVPVYRDIRTLTARQVFQDHGSIDVVCGSPPCQDASTANAGGRGVDGARTGLFFDAFALVAGLRPAWVCLENVPGLKSRGYDRVHDALEGIGYECRALVVGAWHAGAPHRRNRVVVVANLPGLGRGSGGPRGFGAGHPGQPQQAFHDADPATVFRKTVAGRQPDRAGAGVAAHTVRGGRQAAGEFRARQSDAARPAVDPDRDGQHGEPGDGQVAGALGTAFPHARVRQQLEGQSARRRIERKAGNGETQAIGTVLAAWTSWNGGPPALGGMDDGIRAALAARRGLGRACLAALGDSFVPIFPELIGRFIQATRAQAPGVTAP